MSDQKSFLHYSRLGVSEGLNTETDKLEMNLDQFNKDIFKECSYCQQVFAIKKFFERDKKICNVCVGLLEKEVKISPKIYMFWRNNTTYRVFKNLVHNYAERIFHREPIIDKSGQISREKVDIYLNHLLNYD